MSEKNQSRSSEVKYNKTHLYNTNSPPKVSVEFKPRINDVRLNKIRTFSRKNSSKIMKFNCNNSSHFDVTSERKKKQFELQKAYNSTSVNINYSFKAGSKSKGVLYNKSSFKEFQALIDKQLNAIENSESVSVSEYIGILKQISQRDEFYGNILNRVIKGLSSIVTVSDLNEVSNENIKIYSLPSKISLSEQDVLDSSKELTRTKIKFDKNTLSVDYIEEQQKRLKNCTEQFHSSENELSRLKTVIKDLQQEITELKNKETKIDLLLTALKNRGYQIEQIYASDVLSLENKKEDGEGFLYVNENLTSLSSDVSEEFN